MAPRSAILNLPPEVVRELNSRIVASGFAKYEEHSSWLKEKGFPVSKTALHRYAADRSDWLQSDEAERIEVRLKCLDIASRLDEVKTGDDLIALADRLIQWIYKR